MKFDKEVREFITFTSTQPGQTWKLRHLWNARSGWTVEWVCGARSLNLDPAIARKLSRYLASQFRRVTRAAAPERRDLAKQAEMLAWAGVMDQKGKEALHNNRAGVVPDLQTAIATREAT